VAFRLQGQKTAAFEIVEELGDAPDYQLMLDFES
jgi:threonine synthase